MSRSDITLQERHEAELQALLRSENGSESAAYILLGKADITADPWDRLRRTRLTSHAVIPIPAEDMISASGQHITWSTRSFVRLCRQAKEQGLVAGIVHSHPTGLPRFSDQDDRNERELYRLARNRNGEGTQLVSLLRVGQGRYEGRLWVDEHRPLACDTVLSVGARFRALSEIGGESNDVLARQALAFGPELNQLLRRLKVGVVGCGGTGSATAMLLARLGVGQLALFDSDIVEATNLNRLYGATREDADAMRLKVDVVAREVARMGVGVRAVPIPMRIDADTARDALLSCDVIFGCTDDHAGRLFLNRFAYFYLRPVIDMGLSIEPEMSEDGLRDMSGRVTVIAPAAPCLLCRRIADPHTAAEEELRQAAPEEHERQKREAYVRGAGNPAPAVVTFTTEVACMAVNELLQGLIGYRDQPGWFWQRARRLDLGTERRQGAKQDNCILCVDQDYWGRGDVEPFLDRIN